MCGCKTKNLIVNGDQYQVYRRHQTHQTYKKMEICPYCKKHFPEAKKRQKMSVRVWVKKSKRIDRGTLYFSRNPLRVINPRKTNHRGRK